MAEPTDIPVCKAYNLSSALHVAQEQSQRVEASSATPGSKHSKAANPCHNHHSSQSASARYYLTTRTSSWAISLMSAACITTSQRREGRSREFESITRGHTAWLALQGFRSPLCPRDTEFQAVALHLFCSGEDPSLVLEAHRPAASQSLSWS